MHGSGSQGDEKVLADYSNGKCTAGEVLVEESLNNSLHLGLIVSSNSVRNTLRGELQRSEQLSA